MKKPKRKKTRTAAQSRAASLKSWRTRMRMQQARLAQDFIEYLHPDEIIIESGGDTPRPRTIDLLPKVKWP